MQKKGGGGGGETTFHRAVQKIVNLLPKLVFYEMPLNMHFHSTCKFFYLYKTSDLYFTEM